MSIFIDHKFIGMLAPQLQMFKRKKADLYNCRCPLCGDSKKRKTAARGYFFVEKNEFLYKCHNCGVCLSLGNFLKAEAPHLYKDYIVERYKTGTDRRSTPAPEFKFPKPKFNSVANELRQLQPLTKLPESHPAIQFMIRRRFPKYAFTKLYYTDDFATWASLLDSSKGDELRPNEARLVIPFFNREGELYAAQGRSLDPNERLRYITCVTEREDGLSNRRWFGLERHKTDETTIIVEGPLDTFFIDNAIAMCGAGTFKDLPVGVEKETSIIVYDNEPRNREIVKYMRSMLRSGFTVCVWPAGTVGKDINDMVLAGRSKSNIQRDILRNAFGELAGFTKLSEWARVSSP